jgi:hypothetical protein
MSAIDGSELDGYEALVSALRANPPVAPDRLRQRVLEGAPTRRPRRSKKRRLALVVVPLAVVAAVGAAFVHGFQNSGSGSNATAAREMLLSPTVQSGIRGSLTNTTPEAAVGAPPLAPHRSSQKKALASGTNQSWNTAATDKLGTVGSGSALYADGAPATTQSKVFGYQGAVTIPKGRLVHAVAALQVRVKSSDLSAKTNEASQIAGQFGGYAQSVHYENAHQGGGSAVLQLRIPVQRAQAAIAKLTTSLGKVVSEQVSTQDLQQQLTHQTSQIGSLRRAITVYETALQSTTISASDRATLQIRLNNARRQLSQARHARRGTLASGATADISLLLATRSSAIVTPQHHGSSRIGRLLGSAAHFLALEGIIVLYALIVAAPFLLIGGLVWWILRERRRREERLLSTA